MESTIKKSTCLGDVVGYLPIETVGRGETASKIDEGVDVVKGLIIDLYLSHVCS